MQMEKLGGGEFGLKKPRGREGRRKRGKEKEFCPAGGLCPLSLTYSLIHSTLSLSHTHTHSLTHTRTHTQTRTFNLRHSPETQYSHMLLLNLETTHTHTHTHSLTNKNLQP